jgi:predicted P-loop ATPase
MTPQNQWRQQLHRLQPLDLPLLAVGGGPKGKAPLDPTTGAMLADWPTKRHSTSEITNAHAKVTAAGTRTGADAGGLLVFDIDGPSALEHCLAKGCDPTTTTTWQIHRDTDPCRLKVAFKLTAEHQKQLGQIHIQHTSKKEAALDQGDLIEIFHGVGQVVLMGHHRESSGHYFWPDGCGPEQLALITESWWRFALAIANHKKTPKAPPPTSQPAFTPTDFPPRPESDLLEALKKVPEFFHDGERREELVKLALRLSDEVGTERAYNLMAAHSPTVKDMADYFRKKPDRLKPGGIWPFLRERYGVDIRRHDLKRTATPPPSAQKPERPLASFQAIIQTIEKGWKEDEGSKKSSSLPAGHLANLLPAERFRFNELAHVAEVQTSSGWQEIRDSDLDSAYVLLTGMGWKIGIEPVTKALLYVARQQSFHPVRDYLKQIEAEAKVEPFDLDRVAAEFFRAPATLHAAMVRAWLIAAVARAMDPGCQMDACLVLQGDQGLGKSRALEALASADWFCSTVPDQDKDFLLNVHSCWVFELAELESITGRREEGRLKNLITTPIDRVRPPYARSVERMPRQSVFAGTVNPREFLRDDTGNRRFWVVPIEGTDKLDTAAIKTSRDRIWKAAMQAWRAGEKPMLPAALAQASEQQNAEFSSQDAWLAMLEDWINGQPHGKAGEQASDPLQPFTTAQALISAGLRPTEQLSRADEMRVAGLLRQLGYSQAWRRKTRVWLPPQPHPSPQPATTSGQVGRGGAEVLGCNGSQRPPQPPQPQTTEKKEDMLQGEPAAVEPYPQPEVPKKVVAVVAPPESDCAAADLTTTTCPDRGCGGRGGRGEVVVA